MSMSDEYLNTFLLAFISGYFSCYSTFISTLLEILNVKMLVDTFMVNIFKRLQDGKPADDSST